MDSWKAAERYSVERKENDQEWRFPDHPNLVIEEAERIRFQKADILVDYCEQYDAMIVSVVSLINIRRSVLVRLTTSPFVQFRSGTTVVSCSFGTQDGDYGGTLIIYWFL